MKLPELRSAEAQKLIRFARDLDAVVCWDDMIEVSLSHMRRLPCCDCLCWNEWDAAYSCLTCVESHDGYDRELANRMALINRFVIGHPVVVAGELIDASREVKQVSRFENVASFRENPLYREVYRFVDADYQLAFAPYAGADCTVIVSASRLLKDFSKGERQTLHAAGLILRECIVGLKRLESMRSWIEDLRTILEVNAGLGGIVSLSNSELYLVEGLLRGKGVCEIAHDARVRRDTMYRKIGCVVDKLGVDDVHEALAGLNGIGRGSHGVAC